MDGSILGSIKNFIGLTYEAFEFDETLIGFANSAIDTLKQIGVPVDNFRIITGEETYDDFLPDLETLQAMSRDYVCFKVKQAFDPPQSSFVLESLKQMTAELEWRIRTQVEDLS